MLAIFRELENYFSMCSLCFKIHGTFCFVDRVMKNQLDAQHILGIFRQPVYVSGVFRPIIRRYNRMYTTIDTYYSFQMMVCCPGWVGQGNRQSSKKNNKYSTNCCIYTVVPPDDGPRYARNL
jgi:hypothetical protein